MVSSLNGKITKGNNNTSQWWASKEDQAHFHGLLKKAHLIVMGSKTYEAAKQGISLTSDKLRVVLTRKPKKYASEAVPGRLEFSNKSPKQLVSSLAKRGYSQLLLVGGGEVNALFLKSGLVNELYLTLEPLIFGTGKELVAELPLDVKLKLLAIKKLNKRGTILCRYAVSKQTR